jgi:hypothetical protein
MSKITQSQQEQLNAKANEIVSFTALEDPSHISECLNTLLELSTSYLSKTDKENDFINWQKVNDIRYLLSSCLHYQKMYLEFNSATGK